jgi:hypothetical protein
VCGATCVRACACGVCRLGLNSIGDEGVAAISRGLASVPQLQALEYVFVVCVCELVVPSRPRDPVAQSVRGWVRVCVQSVWACDVGCLCVCGATCLRACACGVVWPCAAWAGTGRGTLWRRACGAGCECACRVCGRATWGACVCAVRHVCVLAPVVSCGHVQPAVQPHRARGCGGHQPGPDPNPPLPAGAPILPWQRPPRCFSIRLVFKRSFVLLR